jgi:hypothetical protein
MLRVLRNSIVRAPSRKPWQHRSMWCNWGEFQYTYSTAQKTLTQKLKNTNIETNRLQVVGDWACHMLTGVIGNHGVESTLCNHISESIFQHSRINQGLRAAKLNFPNWNSKFRLWKENKLYRSALEAILFCCCCLSLSFLLFVCLVWVFFFLFSLLFLPCFS